jgi:sugar O-acyltransferase (sialic acid O-acetyltransferase NeuD family)
MAKYVVFGDSAFAERIHKYISIEKVGEVLAFTNEESFITRSEINGVPVVPFERLSKLYDIESFELLICIGYAQMNQLREKIYHMCKKQGYKIGTWISKSALIYSEDIEEGNIIMPGTLVGPTCSIGKCNIIASRVCISHDSIIGNFNFISSAVTTGGFANIGNNTFIGLNATIRDGIKIEDYTLVGTAANVLMSTICEGVYVGNPAKKLENKSSLFTKI